MDIFTKIGLSNIEIKIYKILMIEGALSIAAIAQKTGLYRPQIYKYIPIMLGKNLIIESRYGQRKIYLAESPRQLEKMVDKIKLEVQGLIPKLLESYNASASKPVVSFFNGENGIRHVYKDLTETCKKGDIYYRYESPKNYCAMRKYVPDEYRSRIRDLGEVERLIITNKATLKQKKQRLGRLIKEVPAQYGLFDFDISQLIYGNKVAFIDFSSKTATLVESSVFAEFQKKIFRLLFDRL